MCLGGDLENSKPGPRGKNIFFFLLFFSRNPGFEHYKTSFRILCRDPNHGGFPSVSPAFGFSILPISRTSGRVGAPQGPCRYHIKPQSGGMSLSQSYDQISAHRSSNREIKYCFRLDERQNDKRLTKSSHYQTLRRASCFFSNSLRLFYSTNKPNLGPSWHTSRPFPLQQQAPTWRDVRLRQTRPLAQRSFNIENKV